MKSIILLNSALQFISLFFFDFIIIHKIMPTLGVIVFIFFHVVSLVIIAKSFKEYKFISSVTYCFFCSLSAMIIYNIFGYIIFPGILDDVLFLSKDHLYISGQIFVIAFLSYNLGFIIYFDYLIKIFRRAD